MPLSLELWNKSTKVGRLLLDRSNLVIQFIPASHDINDVQKTRQLRQAFHDVFVEYLKEFLKIYKHLHGIFNDKDRRHRIEHHLCEADVHTYHIHFKFIRDINAEIMKEVYERIPSSCWFDFISEDCLKTMKYATHAYFLEQENSEEAKCIEKDYREEKQKQLKMTLKKMGLV